MGKEAPNPDRRGSTRCLVCGQVLAWCQLRSVCEAVFAHCAASPGNWAFHRRSGAFWVLDGMPACSLLGAVRHSKRTAHPSARRLGAANGWELWSWGLGSDEEGEFGRS